MNIAEIETNLQSLIKTYDKETFIYDFLLAYGTPKATITRLKKGLSNLSKTEGEILLKKKLLFKVVPTDLLHYTIDSLTKDTSALKHNPRFVIVTDYKTLLAVDTKTDERLDIDLKALPKHYDFFLPWAGMEKAQIVDENPADVKAAEKMAKLYDEIVKDNETKTEEEVHALNVFLTRLLFCYFAEDSNIFADNQFTNAIEQHTQVDGSDLHSYIERLFDLLNTEKRESSLPEYLKAFPYVNGGLFRDKHPIPKFTAKSRRIMIEVGSLDWSAINPDIFGSMIQAVITPDHRGGLGMHYTSVPNIMKVIEPLFLDDLYEAFEKAKQSKSKLQNLHKRLTNLKIFDPACGSGNFLIIAYKELRRLEILIYKQIDVLTKQRAFVFSEIKLSQFYGIELDDFAQEVAILSLWLAEHQMNLEFFKEFGRTSPALPLHDGGNIVHGNATRIDWEDVCPKEDGDEIYIMGNPPYLGFNMQSPEQKADIQHVLPDTNNLKFLDYIVCWFFKASDYINENSKFAFVTTNSIAQGTQVPMIWPKIFSKKLEINFAYPEFIWSNNAKHNAGVICSIISVRTKSNEPKYIYANGTKQIAKNINAYLVNGGNTIVEKRQKPLSNLSPISTGNIPYDGGNLILTTEERDSLIAEYPECNVIIRELSGSREYINNLKRYCLWIDEPNIQLANSIKPIKERIEKVRISRENGGKIAKNYSHLPYRFYMINKAINSQIIIPRVSSIRREYIPTGFLDSQVIISDSAQAIYDPEVYIFSVINSKMHMVWVRALAGRLKSDYRYSAVICYNTFPFPNINKKQKEQLSEHVFHILEEREKHSEKTLAQLYDPDKMPKGLKEAHYQLDLAVERCYRKKPFESDEERLEYLFKLYEEMIKLEDRK